MPRIDIPDYMINDQCLACGKKVNRGSLWDNRQIAFFCNVVCVADYDDILREAMQGKAGQYKNQFVKRSKK